MASVRPAGVILTGGTARGAKLLSVPGMEVRPATARVRISLFEILRSRLDGASAVDLFAGTGSLGIEALSRGAAEAVFVETDALALRSLRENLAALDLRSRGRILRQDAGKAIDRLARAGERFRLIFLDPPYAGPRLPATLDALGAGTLLEPLGLVVVQHMTKAPLPDSIGVLRRVKTRRFGQTTLTFFQSAE